MSKLTKAPSSRARRRIGRSFDARCAMASAGAAGLICEYSAEILTERFTTGKSSEFLPSGSDQPRVSRARVSSSPRQRAVYWSASISLTTASPRRSTVNPIFCVRRFRNVFISSRGFFPAINWCAIPETFQRKARALAQGAIRARRIPA